MFRLWKKMGLNMKKLEFETSKGMFVVTDVPDILNGDVYYGGSKNKGIKLSEITEEQASVIVDSNDEYGVVMYQNYQTTSMQYYDEQITAIEYLHSLLKSKGVHLFENPIDLEERLECNCDICYGRLESDHEEAEEKTFYNPYVFKI